MLGLRVWDPGNVHMAHPMMVNTLAPVCQHGHAGHMARVTVYVHGCVRRANRYCVCLYLAAGPHLCEQRHGQPCQRVLQAAAELGQ